MMSDNPKMPRVIKVYNDPDTTTHTMKGCDFWAGVSGTAGWAGKQTEYTLKSQADAMANALKALSDVSYETFQAWPDLEEQARAALAAYQEGE